MRVDNLNNTFDTRMLSVSARVRQKFLESFQDILKWNLNSKSNPRSSRLELTGILIPCFQEYKGRIFRFKLGTQTEEYLLSMSIQLYQVARKASWDEVLVRGYLNLVDKTFEVEKIIISQSDDPAYSSTPFRENSFDVDDYAKLIQQKGKIEPSMDDLAS